MARPKIETKNLKVKINLTLSVENKNNLKKLREIYGKSASEIIEIWIKNEMKKIERKESKSK